jgi:predicted RNA-binding Zn-ribbon protein involved in translation (DUF1610 family)
MGEIMKHRISMTQAQFRDYEENFNGVCTSCGAEHFGGVEGDAENYPCEYCGENAVMGMHWLLFTDKINLLEEI